MDISNLEKALKLFNDNKREVLSFDFVATDIDNPYASKLGGTPYLPSNFNYPTIIKKKKIKNLSFMCQFNLEEVFENFGASLLPQTGILQFYILSDYCVGETDELSNDKLFKIIYHKEINDHNPTQDLLNKIHDKEYERKYAALINGIFNMSFSKSIHSLDPSDILSAYQILKDEDVTNGYSYNTFLRHLLPDLCEIEYSDPEYKESHKILELFESNYYEEPHHLFGFAHFQQSDDLDITPEVLNKDYVCLLQFSPSDEMFDCSFNFRIPREDLILLNFDNAIINMDCT